MNSVKLGALVVLLVCGQGLAQTSYMNFQLALGGDNQAAAWENPTDCSNFPTFIPGSTTPLQSYPPNSIITWDVRVIAGGNHTTERGTYATAGAANIVFNLELRVGSDTGPLADFPASDALGAARGWFSSINNGDPGGGGTRHTVCGQPADPEKKAAFAVSFQVAAEAGNAHYGRAIDITATGGPNLGYALYPSASGFPTGSTALSGTLMGMGCGYKGFRSSGCPGNSSYCHYTGVDSEKWSSAGVGLSSGSTLCNRYLGIVPVFEGQMNTGGLSAGTYVLRLVPGSGCNLMDGGISCDMHDVDAGKFAYKPDVALAPVSIPFVLQAPPSAAVAGRYLFYNNASSWFGAFPNTIDTGKQPLIHGTADTTTTMQNHSGYSKGLNGICVDVQGPAAAPVLSDFVFKYGNTNNPATINIAAPAPTLTVFANTPVAGTYRCRFTWPDYPSTPTGDFTGKIPNRNWLLVVTRTTTGLPLLSTYPSWLTTLGIADAGDYFFYGICAYDMGQGNSAVSMQVTTSDWNNCYPNRVLAPNHTPITNNWDVTKDSMVTTSDWNNAYTWRTASPAVGLKTLVVP